MRPRAPFRSRVSVGVLLLALVVFGLLVRAQGQSDSKDAKAASDNAVRLVTQGQQIFRFDTFGDQTFWGDTLRLHQAIAGAGLGGVGPGVSPRAALTAGLTVDVDALPGNVRQQLERGAINLDDPAATIVLLKAKAVVGLTGFFNSAGALESVGIQCALCHSTVDNSLPALCAGVITPNPGTGCVGRRLDGWPNRDLNVGAIIALAPDLNTFASLLGVTQATVRTVLNSWGPGKFDAELVLDGKAVNPQQVSHGVLTGSNVTAATLIPPAFGMGGVNLHTWTGWGSVSHWNAFVANLEMHGTGRFRDARLENAAQFPIAAAHGFGDLKFPSGQYVAPADDLITPKLAALQLYQLAIPSPQPPTGSFDTAAAGRGGALFRGKARCNDCHVEPLWTDPGWNMHTPAEVCIDSFQADRAPDRRYRTAPLGALFTHLKGGFYHDGRFATLMDVVDHYNACFALSLSSGEKNDLIQYLLSLSFGPKPEGNGKSDGK